MDSQPPGLNGSWLSCAQLVEIVTDYVEDRLTVTDRLRFEEHVSSCGPCRTYLAQMRETIRLTGSLREGDIDSEARDTLLEAFRGWTEEER
jgi:anti-sigma factor RsiW